MAEIGAEVMRLIRWISENDCYESAWLTDGKPAKGLPDNWNEHLCRGRSGSIVVSAEAWVAASKYFEPNPAVRPSMWRLTPDGRAAIAKATTP